DAPPAPSEPAAGAAEGEDDSSSDGAAGASEGAAPPATATGSIEAGAKAPAGELDTAALCAKASAGTTRVSMEVCGLLDPKCLDSFHKHVDGATREKCQEKLDRLPALVEKHKRGNYVLPPECR